MKLLYKIKYKLTKPVTPPPYEKKRAILNSYRETYSLNILVETGTFFGETVEFFKNSFKKLYSIELAEDLALKAQRRFENDKHITIMQGDSGKILKTLVKEFKEPVLFWLDGHYSSEFYVGEELIKTARTDKDTPIVEELDAILASSLEHVILIDDARGFNGLGDYPSIGSIKRKVKKAKGSSYVCMVENDIIQIYPRRSK